MQKKFKILIVFLVIIFGVALTPFLFGSIKSALFLEDEKRIEENSPPIEITGIVDYTPTFDTDEVYLHPDENELFKIEDTGMTKTWLFISWFNDGQVKITEELDNKHVKINGVLKKDGNEYVLNGNIPIIIVHEIEILN